jgi:uncharacterized protein
MRELHKEGKIFLEYIYSCIQKEAFLKDFVLDHICFRTASLEEYTQYKTQFSKLGKLLSSNLINDREISIYKLEDAIEFGTRKTSLLELTQPKSSREDKSEFEHIELVTTKNLRTLVEENPHLNFNTKNIDDINAEIRLNYLNGVIKFRNIGLEKIIELES